MVITKTMSGCNDADNSSTPENILIKTTLILRYDSIQAQFIFEVSIMTFEKHTYSV